MTDNNRSNKLTQSLFLKIFLTVSFNVRMKSLKLPAMMYILLDYGYKSLVSGAQGTEEVTFATKGIHYIGDRQCLIIIYVYLFKP